MGCLRRIAGVSKREHLQNTVIKGVLGGKENVLQRISGRRMKCELCACTCFPQKRWLDNVREDCERAMLTLTQAVREAHDRVKWRAICKLSMRASASPGHPLSREVEQSHISLLLRRFHVTVVHFYSLRIISLGMAINKSSNFGV